MEGALKTYKLVLTEWVKDNTKEVVSGILAAAVAMIKGESFAQFVGCRLLPDLAELIIDSCSASG